jgi:TonB family protein
MPGLLRFAPHPRLQGPRLTVAWQTRWQDFRSSVAALLHPPKAPKEFQGGAYFRDCWVGAAAPWFQEAHHPRRAFVASVLWHIALFTLPLPIWKLSQPSRELTLPRIEVAWSGPIRDFPPLDSPGPASKPSPPGELDKPLPRRGANAFHPRQTIISSPKAPTHPRQTLIQPDAPQIAPKILPPLPNIVEWAQPARPRLRISQADLARFRPKHRTQRPAAQVPLPEVPNLEKRVGEINIASSPMTSGHPLLPVMPTSAPRPGPQQNTQDPSAAPDIAPTFGGENGNAQRLIALSATPAPAPPAEPIPPGNLSARLSISPEGTQPGVPGGSPNGTLGANGGAGGGPGSPGGTGGSGGTHPGTGDGENGGGPAGISITGGDPNRAGIVSGLGAAPSGIAGSTLRSLPTRPEPRPAAPEPVRPSAVPNLESMRPGAPPEQIFGPKRVYTLHVNMPNLSSATGSWVLSFVELTTGDPPPGAPSPPSDLVGPVPVHKVDPKYPPALAHAKIEGEVVLYAIIRRDGSVDSIQLVKGVDAQLDRNAMEALAKWKFRPAERNGAPIELEALAHIPFRAVAPLY